MYGICIPNSLGPQIAMQIHRSAEGSAWAFWGTSAGKHRGTSGSPPHLTPRVLGSQVTWESVQPLTGWEKKKQIKLNDLLACVWIQAHENFSQGPELSVGGRQPRGCEVAHEVSRSKWAGPSVTSVLTRLRFKQGQVQSRGANSRGQLPLHGEGWPKHAEERFSQESS